jgi:hypothetical protein
MDIRKQNKWIFQISVYLMHTNAGLILFVSADIHTRNIIRERDNFFLNIIYMFIL